MNYTNKNISPSMLEKKKLQFDLEVKTIRQDGTFSGYASVFDLVDNHNDIIRKGAFKGTLGKGPERIKLLWQHKQDEPIGVFTQMFEDEMGLYVEGKLLMDVQRAKEAYTLLKQGIVQGLSIGYSPLHYHIDAKSGARELTEVELWEVSLVTFPANAAANVTVVKSLSEVDKREEKRMIQSGEMIQLQDALDRAKNTLEG